MRAELTASFSALWWLPAGVGLPRVRAASGPVEVRGGADAAVEVILAPTHAAGWVSWSMVAVLLRGPAAELVVGQRRLVEDLLAFLRRRGVHSEMAWLR